MTEKSRKKRALILERAHELFLQKGYTDVTMQDIVEACGISRGGVYVYFSSVDEIFLAVIAQRNKEKLSDTRQEATAAGSVSEVLDTFFTKQKHRLLNLEHSLSLAMYEYSLSHSGDEYRAFYTRQFGNTHDNVLEMLRCCGSVPRGKKPSLSALANHVMFVIEGLTTLALSSGIEEEMVDSQFSILQATITRYFGEEVQ